MEKKDIKERLAKMDNYFITSQCKKCLNRIGGEYKICVPKGKLNSVRDVYVHSLKGKENAKITLF